MVLPVIVQMCEAMRGFTADDVDEVIGALLWDGDSRLSTYSPILVTARGRREGHM